MTQIVGSVRFYFFFYFWHHVRLIQWLYLTLSSRHQEYGLLIIFVVTTVVFVGVFWFFIKHKTCYHWSTTNLLIEIFREWSKQVAIFVDFWIRLCMLYVGEKPTNFIGRFLKNVLKVKVRETLGSIFFYPQFRRISVRPTLLVETFESIPCHSMWRVVRTSGDAPRGVKRLLEVTDQVVLHNIEVRKTVLTNWPDVKDIMFSNTILSRFHRPMKIPVILITYSLTLINSQKIFFKYVYNSRYINHHSFGISVK